MDFGSGEVLGLLIFHREGVETVENFELGTETTEELVVVLYVGFFVLVHPTALSVLEEVL